MSAQEFIRLLVGSADLILLRLRTESGAKEDLSEAISASMVVKKSADDAANILIFSTVALNLEINVAEARLEAQLSQVQADALVPGTYIGEAAIEFATAWRHTARFTVKVQKAMAPHP